MKKTSFIVFIISIATFFFSQFTYSQQDTIGDNEISDYLTKGQELYSQKEYDQAILQFQKYISKSNRGEQTDVALLYQSKSFLNLRDTNTAKMIFRKLQSQYPESKYANLKFEDIKNITP